MIADRDRPSGAGGISRRAVLFTGAASLAAVVLGDQFLWTPRAAASDGDVLALVAPLAAGQPSRALFDGQEQVLARFLQIVAPMANDIVDDDPERLGYMAGGWWRTPSEPYNARVQEQVATLSWFYAHQREWNPYHLDGALLARVEVAVDRYLSLQHDDGSFPEYAVDEHSRPATGFGLTALSVALANLREPGSMADASRLARIEAAIRRAAAWFVDLGNGSWKTPLPAVNQTVAGLAGVARAAAVLDDASLLDALDERIGFVAENGQAPAGFFHEELGFDFGYNYDVMMPDLADIHMITGNETVVEMARRWTDFFSYASVREPGSAGYMVYSAIASRGGATTLTTFSNDDDDRSALSTALVEAVPLLAAFRTTREEKADARRVWRDNEKRSADGSTAKDVLEPREKKNTSPRLWIHTLEAPDAPSEEKKTAAEASLPYIRRDRFTERRVGTLEQEYLFVRRPSYYLASFEGVRSSELNRTGPGLLWLPGTGTLVLALNVRGSAGWGIKAAGGGSATVADTEVTYYAGHTAEGPPLDGDALFRTRGMLTSRSVSTGTGAATDVSYWDDGISITTAVDGRGALTVPLVLRADDEVSFSNAGAVVFGTGARANATGLDIVRGGTRIKIGWANDSRASIEWDRTVLFSEEERRHCVLHVPFEGSLRVDLSIAAAADIASLDVPVVASMATLFAAGRRRFFVRATNFDTQATDLRIATSVAERRFPAVPAGRSIVAVFEAPWEATDWAYADVEATQVGGEAVSSVRVVPESIAR